MRAVAMYRFGSPDVLEVVERAVPDPAPGDVRIRVAAATVNPTDTLLRSGKLAPNVESLTPPYIPGMEASGTVDAVGSDVSLKPGTRVMAFVNPFRAAGGAQAEYIVVPQEQVVVVPQSLDLVAIAGLPMNGLTADLALSLLDLPPGSTVAVTGGTGALGGYSIQLAKQLGLRVAADAFARDRGLLQELGADIIVPRGPGAADNFREAIPEGVDGLIDAAILGAAALGAVKDEGALVKCRPYEIPAERGIAIHGVNVFGHPAKKIGLERLVGLAEKGKITLRTAAVLEPGQAAEAHRRLEAGGVRGRMLIRF